MTGHSTSYLHTSSSVTTYVGSPFTSLMDFREQIFPPNQASLLNQCIEQPCSIGLRIRSESLLECAVPGMHGPWWSRIAGVDDAHTPAVESWLAAHLAAFNSALHIAQIFSLVLLGIPSVLLIKLTSRCFYVSVEFR